MRILVTGARGMLGSDLCRLLEAEDEVVAADIEEFDITRRDDAVRFAKSVQPEMIINCAAYTNVDGCETNKDLAFAVNAEGAGNIAGAAAKSGSRLIHISTDYAFDGKASEPYAEDAPTNPISLYGRSKLEGEKRVVAATPADAACIVRTSWLYGKNGRNFVATIIRLARERDELQVVNDQRGRPTYTRDLALVLQQIAHNFQPGILNAANSGECTWYEFASHIIEVAGLRCTIKPVTTAAFPRPAPRPAYSVLSLQKLQQLYGIAPRHWREAVQEFILTELSAETE